LASLWEVHDRVAVSFMKRFYDYLKHHPRDEALRLTQLDCLGKENSDHVPKVLDNVTGTYVKEPFYWASYVLCGDYRRLQF